MLPLIVVDGDDPPLPGRNWLEQLKLHWRNVFHVRKADTLSDFLSRDKMVFYKGRGTIKGFKADIKLQGGAIPIFRKARLFPYALRQNVEEELDRLKKLGVVKKLERSDWASPIVCVDKKDVIRIVGDFKVSVNQVQNLCPCSLSVRTMDPMLQGIGRVRCRISDIIIRTDPYEHFFYCFIFFNYNTLK